MALPEAGDQVPVITIDEAKIALPTNGENGSEAAGKKEVTLEALAFPLSHPFLPVLFLKEGRIQVGDLRCPQHVQLQGPLLIRYLIAITAVSTPLSV